MYSVILLPMRVSFASFLAFGLVVAAASPGVGCAQTRRIVWSTRHPSGGTLVRFSVTIGAVSVPVVGSPGGGPFNVAMDDSIADIEGTFAGEPLHFRREERGGAEVATAFAAMPITASDSVAADVEIVHANGRMDSLHDAVRVPHQVFGSSGYGAISRGTRARGRRLKVDRRFTMRQDSATLARIDNENQEAREVGKRAHDTPQLWSDPFILPRVARITSRFGTGRV